MAPESWTDPKLASYSINALFPYVIDQTRGGNEATRIRTYRERFGDPDVPLPPGWEMRAPADLESHNLGRWFHREVGALFLGKDVADAPEEEEEREEPRFRWMKLGDPVEAFGKELGGGNARIALVTGRKKGWDEGAVAEAKYLPQGLRFEAMALLSHIGVCMVGIRLLARRGRVSLSQAMELAHFLSYGGRTNYIVLLIPPGVAAASLRRVRDEEAKREEAGESEERRQVVPMLTEAELAECLSMSPEADTVSTGLPTISSMVLELRDSALDRFGGPRTYLACQGKIPVVECIQLPWKIEEESLDAELEWVAARFHRHPTTMEIVPPGDDLSAGGVRRVTVTGTQKFLLTCEGMLAVGYAQTAFDRNWPSRVDNEYFLTFLIALHQSVVAQDISWRSYRRRGAGEQEGEDKNMRLFRAFRDFDTDYNFARVSYQANVQGLYDTSREALGVDAMVKDVRDELDTWLEGEQRKEDRALNSLAIFLILISAVTVFINLNLTAFDDGAVVNLGDRTSLWLWAPLAAVCGVAVFHRGMRRHILTAFRYLFRAS